MVVLLVVTGAVTTVGCPTVDDVVAFEVLTTFLALFWAARNCVTIFVKHSKGFNTLLTVVVSKGVLKSNEWIALAKSVINPLRINIRTNCDGLIDERDELPAWGSTICPNKLVNALIRWCLSWDSGSDSARKKAALNSPTNILRASEGKFVVAKHCKNTLASFATCEEVVPCVEEGNKWSKTKAITDISYKNNQNVF